MIRRFHTLFRILVNHTYYLDRVCPDFQMKPTGSARQKLQRFGLLYRNLGNGCKAVFEAEDEVRTPLVEIEGDQSLAFLMKLRNPTFFNFTDGLSKKPDEIYYYDNLSGNTMARQTVKLKPSLFKYPYESTSKNINLSLTNAFGAKVYDKDLSSESKKFNHEIDARSWTPGIYEVKVKVGNAIKSAQWIYISDEAVSSGCFGIVEVFQKGTVEFDYNTQQDYTIEFAARSVPWKFLIELTKDFSSHTFKIEDKEDYSVPPPEPNYPYASAIKFVEVGPTTHQKGERVEFVSATSPGNTVDVPLSEETKKKLQLTVSNGTGQLVVQNLPNPPVSNSKAEVYLKI